MSIVLRVISQAGRSRVEVEPTTTINDLKIELAKRLGVDIKTLKVFQDQTLKKPLAARDNDTVAKAGLKNGDMLHIGNKEAQITQLPPPPKQFKPIEKEKEDTEMKKEDEKAQPIVDSSGKVIKAPVKVEETVAKDAYGRVIKTVEKKEPAKEVKMIAGTEAKKVDEEAFVKHQSFENYLIEMKKRCKDKHLPHQKCQNCSLSQTVSYKVNYNCLDHKPYPLGMCNKCLPPAVILNRQTFRHVDYVSFMNFQDISQFVGAWQQTGMYEQRMAWLYGYYSEDPNFKDGVRVNVEAIYEPPQIGEIGGVHPLEDPDRKKADRIAEALTLERVGWMFTTLNKDKVFMTSHQLREAAKLQQQHIVEHPDGYKVSKFVTVVVEQKENQEIGVECYMASDQCQALERDNVLGDSKDPKKMIIREPKHEEAMPAVLREGQGVKEFEPDFFLVSLAHGQPNANNTQFNILKRYDYQVMNRFGKKANQNDLKNFMLGSKQLKTSHERFASFQFLLHIADMLDVETAVTIAHSVASEQKLDSALVELLESCF